MAIAPEDGYTDRIPYEFHPIKIKSRSVNPFQHLAVLTRFVRTFRKVKPDIALLYTIQPNTHGNIAAWLTGVKTISNIAGLGNLYIEKKFATRVASSLYKAALKHPFKVFFQNNVVMKMFIQDGLVDPEKSGRIPGSGVDIERFAPCQQPHVAGDRPFIFLLASRMLWEKGIAEYAEAASRVKKKNDNVIFRLLGPLNVDNPAALTEMDMSELTANGSVEYMGVSDQMEDEIARADCIVLPSYREGLPRILLEAAAMAKPIITTNVPGCSDVVEDGVTGYICEARNADDLRAKMSLMMGLSEVERKTMGESSRNKAVVEFDQRLVFASYQQAVELCELRHKTKKSFFNV